MKLKVRRVIAENHLQSKRETIVKVYLENGTIQVLLEVFEETLLVFWPLVEDDLHVLGSTVVGTLTQSAQLASLRAARLGSGVCKKVCS